VNRLARSLLVALVAITTLFTSMTAANAFAYETDLANELAPFSTDDHGCGQSIYNTYYWACFKPDGDKFFIDDWEKDGRSVGIYWQFWQYGAVQRSGICLHRNGAFHESRCDKNFPENGYVRFHVGRCDGSTENCWYLDSYTNWSGWVSTNTG
jgi:hypothetical protein